MQKIKLYFNFHRVYIRFVIFLKKGRTVIFILKINQISKCHFNHSLQVRKKKKTISFRANQHRSFYCNLSPMRSWFPVSHFILTSTLWSRIGWKWVRLAKVTCSIHWQTGLWSHSSYSLDTVIITSLSYDLLTVVWQVWIQQDKLLHHFLIWCTHFRLWKQHNVQAEGHPGLNTWLLLTYCSKP